MDCQSPLPAVEPASGSARTRVRQRLSAESIAVRQARNLGIRDPHAAANRISRIDEFASPLGVRKSTIAMLAWFQGLGR